jgi:hypothetical protein
MVALYVAVPNIVSSPTGTIWPSVGYVIFTPYLVVSGTRNSKSSRNRNEYDYEANSGYRICGYIGAKDSKSQVYLYIPGTHHLMNIV